MDREEIVTKIKVGKIFIYPTDTVYGLGCDAGNSESVRKIKQIKNRDFDKPLSVIAPSIAWIRKHLIVSIDLKKYLPGPYTLILEKKSKSFLHEVSRENTLGVRIPDADFSKFVHASGRPFITTSVNVSGEKPAQSISQVSPQVLSNVDVVIDGGELMGKPSILVMSNGEEIVR